MGHQFPRQLFITHQHFWWGTSTHHNTTSSAISPQKATYVELPLESFAGETCRVFQAPGRSERLWVSQTTGRLRGALHYIHQGYFTPFYKQDVVTKAVGRRLESQEDYRKLFSGPGALAKEVRDQLIQAWAEHGFSHAYPGNLVVLDDYREIAAGMWFPFKVTHAGWHHNQKNEGRFDFNVSESVVTELAIDRNDLEPYWADFLPNTGDSVQDQRFGVVLNYEFRRDRTQGEILEMVEAEKQKFASNAAMIKQILAPLDELVGKQAPDLPAEGWIGGEMPKPDGKPYLVHFWATWCGPCKNDLPLLKKLAADGVRVVGMHPAGTQAGDVTKVIRDQELGYPTFLPSGNAAGDDRTIGGYPTAMFPYCILVDSEGRVAGHGSLSPELLAKLRALSAEKENRDAK
jgi:thiol-disulfide isomerase/thioredoxin